MARKPSGNFNQNQYINDWKKENMKSIKVTYKTDFVEKFKTACSVLGVTQSEVIRAAMEEAIRKAEL